MDKKEAIIRLEDARDLIVEAKYMVEEILPQTNILGVKKPEILEPVADIIMLLSQLSLNGQNVNVPVEGMYKLLYRDYKKVCEDKKQLQQDIVELMKDKEWDTETASLNLKLMRAERQIAALTETLEAKKETISNLKRTRTELKHILKDLGYRFKKNEEETETEDDSEGEN